MVWLFSNLWIRCDVSSTILSERLWLSRRTTGEENLQYCRMPSRGSSEERRQWEGLQR